MASKIQQPPSLLSVCVTGKEYVGIVRLHNAIESEHTLARVCYRLLNAWVDESTYISCKNIPGDFIGA